ncbi:MAG: hypothetical protein IJY12_01175 [Clostridia bacterium]|nr:hypothetical protein [Clostridia bacterium]
MKKIGLFVALALIVTIGSAYATWNYTVVDPASVGSAVKDIGGVGIAASQVTSAQGTITVTPSDDLCIYLDDTNADHVAELVITGSIEVSFTPSSAEASGINLKYAISGEDAIQYNGGNVFAIDNTKATAAGKNVDQTDTWTITAEELKKVITINGEIKLDTIEEYNAFVEATGLTSDNKKTLTITVSAVS